MNSFIFLFVMLLFSPGIDTEKMTEQPLYTIRPVTEQDVESIMKLLRKTFYIDEPLNEAVELCVSGTCTELDEYCQHSLLEGLSFKAEDGQGNIVGVMISGVCPLKEDENGNDLLSQAKRCKNPKFQKILYVLAKREEGARLWEKYPEDQHLVEVKVAATDPSWRKKGIMNALLQETENLTKQKGFKLLRMDTSSKYSAMSAERHGFTCVYKALYTDLLMNGQPLIVPKPPHLHDCVYIKKLN